MSSTDVQTLMEMGFTQNRAERALAKTNYKGVQLAMDWLFAHEGDADIDEPFVTPVGHTLGKSSESESSQPMETSNQEPGPSDSAAGGEPSGEPAGPVQANSLKCDECGKFLRTEMEAQAHAARTQHSSFSESTEVIKPLTAEEKKEQLDKLQEKLKQKRLEREEQEKKEQTAREKQRRTQGKEIVSIKSKIEEDEIKKIAEQRRREKMDDKLARQRVKDQIEKDKRDRAAKFAKDKETQKPNTAPSPSAVPVATPAVKKEYTDCRLQIRFPSGQPLTQTFSAKEPLAAVRLYIEMNRTDPPGPFSLMTNFPKKVFQREDYEKPLDQLDLVPSAVLIVTKAV